VIHCHSCRLGKRDYNKSSSHLALALSYKSNKRASPFSDLLEIAKEKNSFLSYFSSSDGDCFVMSELEGQGRFEGKFCGSIFVRGGEAIRQRMGVSLKLCACTRRQT
jgi:hypothetical protein